MSHPTDDELVDLALGDLPIDAVPFHRRRLRPVLGHRRRAAPHGWSSLPRPAYAAWTPPADAVWGSITDQLAR